MNFRTFNSNNYRVGKKNFGKTKYFEWQNPFKPPKPGQTLLQIKCMAKLLPIREMSNNVQYQWNFILNPLSFQSDILLILLLFYYFNFEFNDNGGRQKFVLETKRYHQSGQKAKIKQQNNF